MITYYGYTISPNQLETGEGFLICRNVPIARIGTQDYLASEVGGTGNQIIKVIRPESEVFDPAALASFEGKPFTDDHPPVMLTPENVGLYEKGHVQNVRRGTGEWADFVLADIHIHDAATISQVENGKRQISAGYEVEYEDNGDGTLTQRKIRGNHVALVDSARAGERAAIMDSIQTQAAEPPERKSMRKSFWNLFGAAASGKTAEEITKLGAVMDEALADAEEPNKPAEPEEAEKPVADEDTDYQKRLFESIDALTKKFDAFIEAQKPAEPEPEPDPIDEALATIGAELKGEEKAEETEEGAEDETAAEGGEEAHVVPAEEVDADKTEDACGKDEGEADCGTSMDAATAHALLTAVKPVIASMKDGAERKAVSDAVLALVKGRKTTTDSDAVKIAEAKRTNAEVKKTGAKACDLDAVQALYDARNPHKAKKEA